MGRKGVTLIELLVAVSVTASLIGVAAIEFNGWLRKYATENQIKTLQIDLLKTRTRARNRNRSHMIVFDSATPKAYSVFEDSDNDNDSRPDGDDRYLEDLSKAAEEMWNSSDFVHNLASDPLVLKFDRRGLANRLFTIRVEQGAEAEAEYDCVTVFRTRINMGKHDGQRCRHR